MIYPDNAGKNESSDDISEQMLDISSADLIHRRKKPSLVVLGLRQQTTAVAVRNNYAGIVNRLTPWCLWNVLTCGFKWAIHTTTFLVGGIHLFIRTILHPPQSAQ